MKSLRKVFVAAAMLAAAMPLPAFACAACYGKSDSPLAHGMNWGIFTLLGVITSVLACFALFFVHIMRGEKAHTDDLTPKNPSDV
jgi:hypothetical protein